MGKVEYWLYRFKDPVPGCEDQTWYMRPADARAALGDRVEAVPGTVQMREEEPRRPRGRGNSSPTMPTHVTDVG
jgi:hypothetical protein